jgi:hypothetical protein
MGFVFTDDQGKASLCITEDWSEDFDMVYKTLDPTDSVQEKDMQIDNRYFAVDDENAG